MYKIILLIGMCFIATSCQKTFLTETPQVGTGLTFYKTANDLQLATTGLSALINPAFNQMAGFATCYGGDDVTVARAGNKISFSDFDTFQANSSNDRMTNFWNSFYSTIKSCNALIINYPQATATDLQKNNAAGQAYFLRALSYFYLTRTWGAIPLITDVSVSYSTIKSQPADIYTLIVSDLKKAETMLPDQWTGVAIQNGVNINPTKGSAKALLANVYLTMAGWPLKQVSYYALAAAKSKEVIDNQATYGIGLLANYGDLWKKENKYNKETVYGCYYNSTVASAPWSQDNMGPYSSQPGDEGGWDDYFAEINFYNKFPSGPRKNATYQSVYFVNGSATDWTHTALKHPYFQKMRDAEGYDSVKHIETNWIASRTMYVIRFAEVLLTYAEASAMSSGPDANAYNAINLVRSRSGITNLQSGLSAQAFADSVVVERGWEFAGLEPAARWYDLLRTETVGKANSNRNAGEAPLQNIPDDVQHTHYWAPIPINDATLNPKL